MAVLWLNALGALATHIRLTRGGMVMRKETQEMTSGDHLSHDMPCLNCGHGIHTFLPCGDTCDCPPVVLPGQAA